MPNRRQRTAASDLMRESQALRRLTVLGVYGFQVETTSCGRSAPPASVAPLLQRVDATSGVSLRSCGPRSVAPVCCRAPQTEDKVKAKSRGVKRLVIEVRNTGDVLPSLRAMMLGVECSSVELRVAHGSFVCLDFVLVAQWGEKSSNLTLCGSTVAPNLTYPCR